MGMSSLPTGFACRLNGRSRAVLTGISLASSLVDSVGVFLFFTLEHPNTAPDIRSFNYRTVRFNFSALHFPITNRTNQITHTMYVNPL